MTRRLLAATFILAVALVVAGSAGAATPLAALAPPTFSQPLVDAAGVVPDDAERQVIAELTDYQARSGNQIAVAVVDTTGSQSIEDFSIDLARSWGVGQKDKDSGVLVVIATGDRKLRIEVGRGLEGQLTDLQAGRIIRERLVPLLERNDITAAVVQGTRAIRTALGDTEVGELPAALAPAEESRTRSVPWLPMAALAGLGVLGLLSRIHRSGRGEGHDGEDGRGEAIVWGAALLGLGGFGGHGGGGGFGGGGGGGFGGGGASGDW